MWWLQSWNESSRAINSNFFWLLLLWRDSWKAVASKVEDSFHIYKLDLSLRDIWKSRTSYGCWVVDSTFPFSFPSSSQVSYLDHTLIFTPQGIQDFFKVAASNSISSKMCAGFGWHPKKTLWYEHKKSYLLNRKFKIHCNVPGSTREWIIEGLLQCLKSLDFMKCIT